MINVVKTQKNIHEDIEKLVWDFDIPYIDAVLHYCDSNNLDIEIVGIAISKNPILLAKIQEEAESLNFIDKVSRLPI